MADDTQTPALSSLLYALAEGLQSAGNYLRAARRNHVHGAAEPAATSDMIEKAVVELARAQTAFNQLRHHLLSDRQLAKDLLNARAIQTIGGSSKTSATDSDQDKT